MIRIRSITRFNQSSKINNYLRANNFTSGTLNFFSRTKTISEGIKTPIKTDILIKGVNEKADKEKEIKVSSNIKIHEEEIVDKIHKNEAEKNNSLNDKEATEAKIENDPDWFLSDEFEAEQNKQIDKNIEYSEKEKINKEQEYANKQPIEPSSLSIDLLKRFLTEQGAQKISVIDMYDKCNWTDYMIIAQGLSLRHLNSLSERTRLFIKACRPFDSSIPDSLTLEGDMNDNWVVLDGGRYIIHFMTEESRNQYQLESLWNNFSDANVKIQRILDKSPDSMDREEFLEEMAKALESNLIEDEKSLLMNLEEEDLIKLEELPLENFKEEKQDKDRNNE